MSRKRAATKYISTVPAKPAGTRAAHVSEVSRTYDINGVPWLVSVRVEGEISVTLRSELLILLSIPDPALSPATAILNMIIQHESSVSRVQVVVDRTTWCSKSVDRVEWSKEHGIVACG